MAIFSDTDFVSVLFDNNLDRDGAKDFIVDLMLCINRRGKMPSSVVVSPEIFSLIGERGEGFTVCRIDTPRGPIDIYEFKDYVLL